MHSGNTIKFLAGNSHPELAQAIADRLGITPTSCEVKKFSNGETSVRIFESVRDEDVFILQTSAGPDINDFIMELLILISACKTASARRITAIIPCYPYARNAQKDKSRAPITAKLLANMLAVAGCDHVITMDLHASQIQGFFDMPVDNLYSEPLFIGFIKRFIEGFRDGIIVSPDAGGAKRATAIADKLGIDFALIHRSRKNQRGRGSNSYGSWSGSSSRQGSVAWGGGSGAASPTGFNGYGGGYQYGFNTPNSTGGGSANNSMTNLILDSKQVERVEDQMDLLVGDVNGRVAILVDDMIDTGETVKMAANCLKARGAAKIWVLVSHCMIHDMSILEDLPIERLVVCNTIPQRQHLPTAPSTPLPEVSSLHMTQQPTPLSIPGPVLESIANPGGIPIPRAKSNLTAQREEKKSATVDANTNTPTPSALSNFAAQLHLGETGEDEVSSTPVPNGILSLKKDSHDSTRSAATASSKIIGVGGIQTKRYKPMKNKLTVLDISPMLAESIRRTHNGESISLLFGEWAERVTYMY